MRTAQWIKKLGGHAGELFVAAELSKRGIPNALLPENFSDDDILIGNKGGTKVGFIQVKACHPARASTFILRDSDEAWCSSKDNVFCVLVWLGHPDKKDDPPRYWIASKREMGEMCVKHNAHGTQNWERRFDPKDIPQAWENRWSLFDAFCPSSLETALEAAAKSG